VTLEILFVRVPMGQPEVNGALWQAVDEQHLPTDLRRRLTKNGIRVGLLGSHVPVELARVLNMTDQPVTDEDVQVIDELDSEPMVRRRLLQLRAGRRGEILASGVYDQLPLLLQEDGQLSGQTFKQAQGLFAVFPSVGKNGRVRLKLTPEVHHGQSKQQWTGEDGIFQMMMARPKEVFDRLRMETELAPGQMLLISCLADQPGSLGHYFFTDQSAQGLDQKLLVIRLAKMPPRELFAEEAKASE
jgi:hypothetical protein